MKRISFLLLATALTAPACTGSVGDGTGSGGSDGSDGSGSADQYQQVLNSRVVDYNAALRIAALRLTGDLPTLAEINSIANAPDAATQATTYQGLIQQYMSRPAFAQQMFFWWRDTMKMGGTAVLDTAPAFAAELSVNNGSYMDLFTATTGNCPTFDGVSTFTPATCTNGGPVAGILTNPGVHMQFVSNFAFRRVRFVQEVFDCLKFPAEVTATPTDLGTGIAPYTSPWDFGSIAGTNAALGINNGGTINFLDTSAVICANCHTTINHIAPLFAYYDANGMYQSSIAVTTPAVGSPLAQMTDYLPAGQATAWRYQVPAADIPGLGADMAADPAVAACGVARVWNWALGKTDIVDALETVPNDTIQAQIDAFTSGGFKMKDLIYAVYTSDDFVKF